MTGHKYTEPSGPPDVQARVIAMAALRMASGATDEEWVAVMKQLESRDVPDTANGVVDDIRAALVEVRGER